MIRRFVMAVLAVGVLVSSAVAAEKTYVVASDATWPPMEMLSADKKVEGFSTDYINAVAKEVGIKVDVRNTAWDGIFAALGSNQADVIASSVTITEKRKKAMAFTTPYYAVRQAVVVPHASTIKNMKDLDGKKVGGQIGTTGLIETLPKAESKADVKTYDEVGLALEDLVKGNLDAVICDDPIAKFYANKKQEYAGKLRIAFIPDTVEYYGFALRKNDKELLDKLNAGIQSVKDKGIDKEIAKKWLGE